MFVFRVLSKRRERTLFKFLNKSLFSSLFSSGALYRARGGSTVRDSRTARHISRSATANSAGSLYLI
jgi:hypothetical protein